MCQLTLLSELTLTNWSNLMTRHYLTSLDGDSRKMLEQRAREATRPSVPVTRGKWPFSVDTTQSNRVSKQDETAPSDKPSANDD